MLRSAITSQMVAEAAVVRMRNSAFALAFGAGMRGGALLGGTVRNNQLEGKLFARWAGGGRPLRGRYLVI